MTDDEIFNVFLNEYLANVVEELPESFRARQLKMGGMAAQAVYIFETKFLKEPFLKALHENDRKRMVK